MRPLRCFVPLLTISCVGCGAGAVLPGTWEGVGAETRIVDVTTGADLEESVQRDATVAFDAAHDFTFAGDGTGTVTTRAFFNVVGLDYLALDQETVTPCAWQVGGGDDGEVLALTTDDGVSGEWQVSSATTGEVIVQRTARVDFSAQQHSDRTTTLTLRR